jgi:hypothetical protein
MSQALHGCTCYAIAALSTSPDLPVPTGAVSALACSADLVNEELGNTSAGNPEQPHAPVQPAHTTADDRMVLHTTLAAADFAPIFPPESRHERRLFGRARFGSPRTLDALANQGRYLLAHRDSVRAVEAAAAVASTVSPSQPWWRPWQQAWRHLCEDAQLPRQKGELPLQRVVQRYCREVPPLDERKRLSNMTWGGALQLLAAFPGRVLLQPDRNQVQTVAVACSLQEVERVSVSPGSWARRELVLPMVTLPQDPHGMIRRCRPHGRCAKIGQQQMRSQSP